MELLLYIGVPLAIFLLGFFCGIKVFHSILIAPAIRERVLRDGNDVYTLTKRRTE